MMSEIKKVNGESQPQLITIKHKLVIIFFLFLFSYILFMFLDTNYGMTWINIVIFAFSSALVFWGIYDITKQGVNCSNVFLITFFFALSLNNLNISIFQVEKNLEDIYYYFFGPLIFYLMILKNEKIVHNLKLRPLVRVNPNYIGLLIWFIYCFLFIRLINETGIRFVSDDWGSIASVNYRIAGLSGLINILNWLLLMLMPEVKDRYKILFAITTFTCSVLMAKRGDGMRVLLFCIMYLCMNYGKKLLINKNLIKIGVVISCVLVLFSIWGNYRQIQRGWQSYMTIGIVLGSKIENDVFNWLYGYTGMNFENLKQLYIDNVYTYEIKEIFLPIIRIVEGTSGLESYYEEYATYGLGGFNAVPFTAHFIRELGPFYFISVLLLGVIIISFINLGKILEIKGLHVFLMMLMGFSFFGNYFLNISYFYSMVAIIIVYLLFDFRLKRSNNLN